MTLVTSTVDLRGYPHLPILVALLCIAAPATSQTPLIKPFKATCEEALPHNGALDLRFHDIDQDGDEDIVTFNIAVPLSDADIKFWENRRVQGAHAPDLFVPFAVSDILGPALIENGIPDRDYFKGIYDMWFVDIDGDADDDLVAGRLQDTDLVFKNVGGKFVSAQLMYSPQNSDYCGLTARFTTGISIGDVNGDSFPDIAACFRDSKPRLFLNDTLGNFYQDQVFPFPPGESGWAIPGAGFRDIHLVDLDGDLDLDCVLARMQHELAPHQTCTDPPTIQTIVYQNVGYSSGQTFQYWYKLNPGTDCFDDVDTFGLEGSPSLSITLDDADGDGDMDLFQPVIRAEQAQSTGSCVPSGCMTRDYRTRLYLNDGFGVLGTKNLGIPQYRPNLWIGSCTENNIASWAYPEDIDNDGDNDVVIAHYADNGVPDRVWKNIGNDVNGVPIYVLWQTIPSTLGSTNDNTRYVRFADLDLDGDEDYVEANFTGGANPRVIYSRIVPNGCIGQ